MRYIFALSLIVSIFISCTNEEGDKSALKKQIFQMEDSMTRNTGNRNDLLQKGEDLHSSLVDLLLQYYRQYPNDDYAPVCLDKVHMVYSSQAKYKMASQYADTLLMNYKDYINRAMILESQAAAFDIMILPRDTSKVRYYNELLLKENPDLPKDKRDEINFRLCHLDLTYEQMITSFAE